MQVKALGIYLGPLRVGVLFQYAPVGAAVINRFEADRAYRDRLDPPTLSTSFLADTPTDQQAFWASITSAPFNGRHSPANGWLLPSFFQNLLPEGVFRDRVAAMRGCDPKDHFEMLAACGRDLPGNVHALPVELSRDELAHYVTQDQDALEMSVTADPLERGVSLSGVQPKLGVIRQGERYVARFKDHDTHVIAKLPVVGQPYLPEVEELSLRLARAAGVDVCEAWLEPLSKLSIDHGYDLGDADGSTHFLAVQRYDRTPHGRIHCEDFAQVFGEMPEDKYGGAYLKAAPQTYLNVAAVLLAAPTLGEAAVHELLRRLVVNELLGNPDMHLKNMGLRYPDGVTPDFPLAYDIVAYSAFNNTRGHALLLLPPSMVPRPGANAGEGGGASRQMLSAAMVRAFCSALGIPEKPAAAAIKQCVAHACEQWPSMIAAAKLTEQARARILERFRGHQMVQSLERRRSSRVAMAGRAES